MFTRSAGNELVGSNGGVECKPGCDGSRLRRKVSVGSRGSKALSWRCERPMGTGTSSPERDGMARLETPRCCD